MPHRERDRRGWGGREMGERRRVRGTRERQREVLQRKRGGRESKREVLERVGDMIEKDKLY